jgi:MFS family permease
MTETFNGGNRGTVFSGIGFVGTVVGMLTFGYIVDRIGRRNSMFLANIIVLIFSILCTGAWAPTPNGIFRLLTAWRFFQGVGLAFPTAT